MKDYPKPPSVIEQVLSTVLPWAMTDGGLG
jgi:hypothetical protein